MELKSHSRKSSFYADQGGPGWQGVGHLEAKVNNHMSLARGYGNNEINELKKLLDEKLLELELTPR